MKIHTQGEQKSALCHRDGRVTATFDYRSVPFRDGRGKVDDVLVGACDVCGDAIIIPAQSTPAIAAARQKIENSLEVKIPAPFIDVLDAAITRIAAHPTPEFRKPLFVYYVDRFAAGKDKPADLVRLLEKHDPLFWKPTAPKKRLSMKLSEVTDGRINAIMRSANLSKTDIVKSIVLKIYQDIVLPDKPKHRATLAQIADLFYA